MLSTAQLGTVGVQSTFEAGLQGERQVWVGEQIIAATGVSSNRAG